MSFPILSVMTFLPLLAALFVFCVPQKKVALIRAIALFSTGVVLALSIFMVLHFDRSISLPQFREEMIWISALNIHYSLGVDGLSVGLVFLTALLGFLSAVASLGIESRQKEYFIFYLILMTGMMGTFIALDLFLFYVFWETVLVPMYFLIGIWGGPQREYAAIKFFLYTLIGSLFMLIGILVLYFSSTPHTFNMLSLTKHPPLGDLRLQVLVFLAFFIAFAIKVPIFPFHTWLPDAHVQAPTPVSVLLAGVLLKMGGYGLLRICFSILTDAAHQLSYILAGLGAISIVYGAFVAMAQTDFKKMIAYSSVSHMGFVILGLASMTAAGLNGALLQMFNHGIITGAMFLLVGVLYDRAHTRDLSKFGGLMNPMPIYGGLLIVFSLASLGLPGLSGFVGEFLSLIGAYPVFKIFTIVSLLGLVLTAGYFLFMLQRVLLGSPGPRYTDISGREIFTVAPLLVLTVVVGVIPALALSFQDTAVASLVKLLTY
jgi:NADH-quinone oxidoreductase subunit M